MIDYPRRRAVNATAMQIRTCAMRIEPIESGGNDAYVLALGWVNQADSDEEVATMTQGI